MTKYPEQVLADQLQNDPEMALVVGGRIFPVIAPASASLPFVTWRRQSIQREMTLSGPSRMPSVTVSLDFFAETYQAVRELADRARAVLDGFRGEVGNYLIVRIVSLVNESDGFVQLAGGDLPPVYSVTQTYTILWGDEQ